MADAIHEFSSDGSLSYSDIANGHTVATTTGSQTAVIRDIALTVPGEKSLDFKIDDITVAKAAGSSTIGGTLLMKASQTLKMYPSDSPYWTGMKFAYSTDTQTSVRYYNADLSSSSTYFEKPTKSESSNETRVKFTAKTATYFTGANAHVTNKTNGGGLVTGNNITVWWADSQFGKDEGDFYYTEYIDSSYYGNGNNHLKFYDASADTVTEIFNADSSYRIWVGGFSNKHLLLKNASTSFSSYKLLDTTNNSITSAITLKQSSNGQATSRSISDSHSYFSCLDNFCIFKTNNSSGSADKLALMRLSDGRYNYWDTNTNSGMDDPIRNSGSYSTSGWRPALARNTAGTYYVLWPWMRGTGTNDWGLQIFQLGSSSSLDSLCTSGTFGNPDGLIQVTNWKPSSGGDPYTNYWSFATRTSGSSVQGPYGIFRPLKKPTPTDSTARYWVIIGSASQEGGFVLDMDNITSGGGGNMDAGGMAYKIRYQLGGSNQQSPFDDHYQCESWSPTWKSSLLSSAYGTMKQRTTGILST